MRKNMFWAALALACAAAIGFGFAGQRAAAAQRAQARSAKASSPAMAAQWKYARQISAAELAKRISGPKNARPIILQVGFKVLYDGGHIPGAIFAGPASNAEGLARLKSAAEKIPHNKEVIIYCGCCPWEKCPNIRPAYEELRRMGFSRLVVLLIPQDFAHDWVDQGYPVARKMK
ncbi:MAG TPA: rhodanese-like domain-containing protein [Candidatus Acidoferrales bacterium]|nr:rhodanese-like domain-containing protein [Candidatus Acidoferrales bacterium]